MIDVEIDRQKRVIKIYDLDTEIAEGCFLPEKYRPITFEYLDKLLEREPQIRKILEALKEV